MSRNNIWVHLTIALTLILIAAFAGGVRHWRRTLKRSSQTASRPQSKSDERQSTTQESDEKDKVEVLVRFRPGTTRETIDRITAQFNDEVEDRIESVAGLDVIEDEDGRSAEDVLTQYRALAEVEYAEPNSAIVLDHEDSGRKHRHADDEMFGDQWGLFNDGAKGGKAGADIGAMRAWAVTKGSEQVVVAVIDSGVDLRIRIW
jgi:hypothetical protein